MGPRVCRILAAAAGTAAVAVFIIFIYRMATGDIFGYDAAVSDILLEIFIFMGLSGLLFFLMILFIIKYTVAKNYRDDRPFVKRCVSCGTEIGITDMSCHRCFVLQPAEHNNDPPRRR
jgi:hypothetical protein